jgi:hypothetical protein
MHCELERITIHYEAYGEGVRCCACMDGRPIIS